MRRDSMMTCPSGRMMDGLVWAAPTVLGGTLGVVGSKLRVKSYMGKVRAERRTGLRVWV